MNLNIILVVSSALQCIFKKAYAGWQHTLPNQFIFQSVFMAVSIDTFDRESGIHPRNKQLVSSRLATAGLNVAYGQTQYPTQGPFPSSIQV